MQGRADTGRATLFRTPGQGQEFRLSSESAGKDLHRIYIYKRLLLAEWAWPLALSTETVNWARMRPGLIWSWAGWVLNWVKGEN